MRFGLGLLPSKNFGDEPMPPKLPQPRMIRDTPTPLRPSPLLHCRLYARDPPQSRGAPGHRARNAPRAAGHRRRRAPASAPRAPAPAPPDRRDPLGLLSPRAEPLPASRRSTSAATTGRVLPHLLDAGREVLLVGVQLRCELTQELERRDAVAGLEPGDVRRRAAGKESCRCGQPSLLSRRPTASGSSTWSDSAVQSSRANVASPDGRRCRPAGEAGTGVRHRQGSTRFRASPPGGVVVQCRPASINGSASCDNRQTSKTRRS